MATTRPEEAHHVKKGSYVMLKGCPCKIVDVKTSKTGKHGHAKCNITGIDVLTGKKCNEVHPGHIILGAFDLIKNEYEVANIDEKEGEIELMDDTTGNCITLPFDKANEIHDKLFEGFTTGKVCLASVTTAPVGETEPQLQSALLEWKFESTT